MKYTVAEHDVFGRWLNINPATNYVPNSLKYNMFGRPERIRGQRCRTLTGNKPCRRCGALPRMRSGRLRAI